MNFTSWEWYRSAIKKATSFSFRRFSICSHFLPDKEMAAGGDETKQVESRAVAWEPRKEATGVVLSHKS